MDAELFVYDVGKWEQMVAYDYLIDEPAQVFEYDNALLLPVRYVQGTSKIYGDGLLEGGVCDENFNFLAGLSRSADRQHANKDCCFSYKVADSEIESCDDSVIFGGLLTSHFGHMLIDGMTRFWWLVEHPEDTRPIVFLVYPEQSFPFWDLFDLMGIAKSRIRIIERPTRFAHITVPEETFFSQGVRGYRAEWRSVTKRIREGANPSPHKKIYFTRTQFAHSGCIGEEYFEEFFRNNGFLVVAPEKLPLREQISLMSGAEVFASTLGSICFHIVFSKPGTHMICLARSEKSADFLYEVQAAQARLSLVDAHVNVLPEAQGGFSVHLLAPNPCWEAFLQNHPELDPSAAPANYSFSNTMTSYLKAWGKEYAHPAHYRWIRNETVPDIARRIGKYLLGRNVDTTQYLPTAEMERLQDALNDTRSQLLFTRAAYGEIAPATLEIEGDSIKLSGLLRCLPNKHDSLNITANATLSFPKGAETSIQLPAILDFSESDSLLWTLTTPAASLRHLGGVLECQLIIEEGTNVREFPVWVDVKNQQDYVLSIDPENRDLVGLVPKDMRNETLLSIRTSKAILPRYFGYNIESIQWSGENLLINGIIEDELALSDYFTATPCLTEMERRTETVSDIETHFNRGEKWELEVPARDVLEYMTEKNINELMFRWQLTAGPHSSLAPFGRKRPTNSIALYRAFVFSNNERYLLPIEDVNKNFGFRCYNASSGVDEPAAPFIDELSWEGSTLFMAGKITHPLIRAKDFSCCFALISDEGEVLSRRPIECTPSPTANHATWELHLDMAEELGILDCDQCTFAIEKHLGSAVALEPFGRRRTRGTLNKYKQHPVFASEYYWFPVQKSLGNLGFSRDTQKDTLTSSSKPQITHLEWDGCELNVDITTQHALETYDGFSCALALREDSGALYDWISNSELSGNKRIWHARLKADSFLSESPRGTWSFELVKTADGLTDFEPFGRVRPAGTMASFACSAVRANDLVAIPNESEDKMLRFSTAKLQEALDMSANTSIDELAWRGNDLYITGKGKHPLAIDEAFHAGVSLGLNGEYIPLDSRMVKTESLTGFSWSVCFNPIEILGEMADGPWTLVLSKEMDGVLSHEPFGYRRPEGTMATYASNVLLDGQCVIVPCETSERILQLERMTVQKAIDKPTATRISELKWSGSDLLMRGTSTHPLARNDRFSASIALQLGDEHIPIDTMISRLAEKPFEYSWEISFDPAQVLDGKSEGTWTFELIRAFDKAVSFEEFGRRRPEGTLATFQAPGTMGSKTLVTPIGNKETLGFKVEKRKMRLPFK